MAELTGRERDLVQATFIASYYAVHGTFYVLSSRPATEPTDLLFEGGTRDDALKVPHPGACRPRRTAVIGLFVRHGMVLVAGVEYGGRL
jgi:hypothetical protein